MRLAPLGAFGAMSFTVGKYGIGSLVSLASLMGCFYATSILFVVVVLGMVLRVCGLRLFPFLSYIKEEIFVVLGTSSSESALPLMMRKMEKLGCSKPVVGLVVPMGYSFNLDGTSIYLTLATLFVAQATNTHLSFGQELEILAVLLLTSKGAAAVTGGGFITLAATLSAVGNIPVAGLALLLGVDRFMSEARAITNLIGNGVASVAVSGWEKELDMAKAQAVLAGRTADPRGDSGGGGGGGWGGDRGLRSRPPRSERTLVVRRRGGGSALPRRAAGALPNAACPPRRRPLEPRGPGGDPGPRS